MAKEKENRPRRRLYPEKFITGEAPEGDSVVDSVSVDDFASVNDGFCLSAKESCEAGANLMK